MYIPNTKGNGATPARQYTLKKVLEGQITKSAHPARFSPDDKWSRHRIQLQRRYGLLISSMFSPFLFLYLNLGGWGLSMSCMYACGGCRLGKLVVSRGGNRRVEERKREREKVANTAQKMLKSRGNKANQNKPGAD